MKRSAFIEEAVNKRLAELRLACAVQREIKQAAFSRRWARAGRTHAENLADKGTSDAYWDNLQAKAQEERTASVIAADEELARFILEHRELMGPEWIGNDHGRLCWNAFLGGRPIDHHYCQREEGHDGFCQNAVGSWPRGVCGEAEWSQLKKSCQHETRISWGKDMCCEACGHVVGNEKVADEICE